MVFVRSDTTSIEISWKQFTLVELKALANYTVTYSAASTPNIAITINVPWTENSITITNLSPGTRYDITVSVTTPSRISGTSTLYYYEFISLTNFLHQSKHIPLQQHCIMHVHVRNTCWRPLTRCACAHRTSAHPA